MKSIGFIGTGRYTAALAEGMFGIQWPSLADSSNIDVRLFDIDSLRAMTLSAKLRASCEVAQSCNDLLAKSDLVILGVPMDQVGTVISLAAVSRRNIGRPAGVVLMDGVVASSIVDQFPDLPLGALMFNFLVTYRSGIVGLWPGTLLPENVTILRSHLAVLGHLWLTEDLNFLHVIRATAGVGVAVLAELVSAVSAGMKAAGLDDVKAALIIETLVTGCAAHLAAGGSIESLGAAVPSPNSPIVAKAIQTVRDKTRGANAFLDHVFEGSLVASRGLR